MPTIASNMTASPVAAAPAGNIPAISPRAKKKSKRWLVWSGAAVAMLVLLIWGGWMLANRNSSNATQQIDDQSTPATDTSSSTPETKPSRRSHGHKSDSGSESASSRGTSQNPAANQATQEARAQQLVNSGNLKLAKRDFSGAQSDFQQALALDPNNQSAQRGLQAAQAGMLATGLGSIFHR